MEDRGSRPADGGSGGGVLRLFVAISLPDAVKEEIEKAQRKLRAALPGNFIRWTKPAQFHVTLKFLGHVAESRVVGLMEALQAACVLCAPLRLRAERVGFFPGARSPRVLWAGVHDRQNLLPRFQQSVETNVNNFMVENVQPASVGGAPPARGQEIFTGHITLARVQPIHRPQAETVARAVVALAGQFFGEWMAGTVELIRSELSSSGSRYTTLAAIPLSGKK
jgi:2'-5' RNA ligase